MPITPARHGRLDFLDHLLDVVGRHRRLVGQAADFGRDDGKAAPVFAGLLGFDGGVERQQVGLVGDLGDGRDDLVDVAGLLVEHGQLGVDRAGGVHDLAHGLFHARQAGLPAAGQRRPTARRPSTTSFMVLTSSLEVAEISREVAPISVVVAAISLAVACCSLAVAAISVTDVLTWMPECCTWPTSADNRFDHVGERVAQDVALGSRRDGDGEVAGGDPLGHADRLLQGARPSGRRPAPGRRSRPCASRTRSAPSGRRWRSGWPCPPRVRG